MLLLLFRFIGVGDVTADATVGARSGEEHYVCIYLLPYLFISFPGKKNSIGFLESDPGSFNAFWFFGFVSLELLT